MFDANGDKLGMVGEVWLNDSTQEPEWLGVDMMGGTMHQLGFTVAAGAVTYWVGEAMQATDYKDLKETPEKTQRRYRDVRT